MIPEYIECSVQLLFILIALLFSLFRYISSRKKGWLYSAGYFGSSLLSSYFWTVYIIIMGEDPEASSFLTYFGWNVSFFILLLLNHHLKDKEERKYFNPLMLLPVPLNLCQLSLYWQFDGVALSIYQVSVCTLIACSGLQSILWYFKNKKHKSGIKPPYVAVVSLINITAEFGMWTSTCFEGWIHDLYYPASLLSSFTYLLLLRAVGKTYAGEKDGEITGVVIDRRIQNIMKAAYIGIVVLCSTGGFLLGSWVRDSLIIDDYVSGESDVYDVISIILFLISIILVAFAITIILVVYFEQKITENNRLREEKLIAESSNAAKSDFLANMSHEIRTPLNAVLGMNKMIILESKDASEDTPEDRSAVRKVFKKITEYADNIESAGNSLLSIINDILDLSKIEAGKLDLTEHEYMLSSVLNDVSNMVLFRAREKGLDFRMEIAEDIPERLYGDDMRLRQIICNILNNAVKYTNSGSVTLSMHSGEPPADGLTELVIKVSDTGIGIKKEDIARIFDKFERTDLDRNSSVEGTGLGLNITIRLLDIMDGKISVESEYGSGTVFTVRLPQRKTDDEPIGDFRKRFEKSTESMQNTECLFRAPAARILIVDDTRMNLTVAAGLLKDTEIKTDLAESGAAALEMAENNSYDLILLDQRMPVMDGTETLRQLRGTGFTAPVICLTADALRGAREQYLAKGFDDYLSKPIDSADMKKTLMKHLPAEKLLPAVGDPPPETPGSSDPLINKLRKAGLNTVKAMGYCQNESELYHILLGEFVHGAEEKSASLQRFFDGGDAKNYAILVHSLKSSSKTIGADELSALSAELEKAADGSKWDILKENHAQLLADYAELVKIIAEAAGDEFEEVTGDADGEEDVIEFFPEETDNEAN